MKAVILGMGNTLLSDDGVGILIAHRLAELFEESEVVDVLETQWGGFRIIDLLSGYDYAIIIDAIQTGRLPVGGIHKFRASQFVPSLRMVSFHDINFATALDFARLVRLPMPEKISIYAIEVVETTLISEELTPEVEASISRCVDEVLTEIREICSQDGRPQPRAYGYYNKNGAVKFHG